jgi:hypothetical protein
VAEVVAEIGRDWHTVSDTVHRYGEALVQVPGSFEKRALGLDEVLFERRGANPRGEFDTSISDVEAGQLLDVVPGRSAGGPVQGLHDQGLNFTVLDRARIGWATLDLSGPYRAVVDAKFPGTT